MWRTEGRLALLTAAAATVAAVWGCFLPEAERADDDSDGPLTTAGSSGSAVTAGSGGAAGSGGGDAGGGQAGNGGAGPASLEMAATFSGGCASAQSPMFLDFPGEDFTVQFWLRVDTVPKSGEYQHIVWNGGTSATYPGWAIYLAYSAVDRATLSFGTKGGGTPQKASAASSIVEGRLHHVVVTHASGEGKVYVFDATNADAGHALLGESDTLEVGSSERLAFSVGSDFTSDDCNDAYFFKGTLDDLRVYSVAREHGQFNNDFLGPVDCQAESRELLAYWPFDDFAREDELQDSCAGATLQVARRGAVTLDDSPFDSFPPR
jgi:hypothetical protein